MTHIEQIRTRTRQIEANWAALLRVLEWISAEMGEMYERMGGGNERDER